MIEWIVRNWITSLLVACLVTMMALYSSYLTLSFQYQDLKRVIQRIDDRTGDAYYHINERITDVDADCQLRFYRPKKELQWAETP
jgi:hypothetical protein